MRIGVLIATALVGTALFGGVAGAGNDPVVAEPARPAPAAPAAGDLSLVLSIRALAISPAPLTQQTEVERMTAPTGAGSTRWPTGEIAKGVYINVMPACIPGVDEPIGPPLNRRAVPAPARRR